MRRTGAQVECGYRLCRMAWLENIQIKVNYYLDLLPPSIFIDDDDAKWTHFFYFSLVSYPIKKKIVGAYSKACGSGPGRLFNQGSNWDPRKRFYLFRIRDVKVTGQSDFLNYFFKGNDEAHKQNVIDEKNGHHEDVPFYWCVTMKWVTDSNARICISHAHAYLIVDTWDLAVMRSMSLRGIEERTMVNQLLNGIILEFFIVYAEVKWWPMKGSSFLNWVIDELDPSSSFNM
jgi:hypothetical protein